MLCYRGKDQRAKLISIVSCKRQTKTRTIAAPLSPGSSLLVTLSNSGFAQLENTPPIFSEKNCHSSDSPKTLLDSEVVDICGGDSTPLAFFSVLTAVLPRPGPTGYKNIVPNEHVKPKGRPRTTKFKTFLIGDVRFIRISLMYLCILTSASLTPLRAIKLLHSLGKVKRTKLLNQLF